MAMAIHLAEVVHVTHTVGAIFVIFQGGATPRDGRGISIEIERNITDGVSSFHPPLLLKQI